MRSSGKRNYRNESRKTRERKRGVTARSQGVNTVAMPGERSSDREAGKVRIETMWHNRRAGRRGDEKNERTPSRDLVNTQLYTLTILLLCEGHSLHLLKKKKKENTMQVDHQLGLDHFTTTEEEKRLKDTTYSFLFFSLFTQHSVGTGAVLHLNFHCPGSFPLNCRCFSCKAQHRVVVKRGPSNLPTMLREKHYLNSKKKKRKRESKQTQMS